MSKEYPGPTVRPATVDDLAEILAVERSCYEHPWSAAQFFEELERPGGRIDLCRVNGRLAGYHCWCLVCDELHVLNLATAPEFRCRGIGGQLLVTALEEARRRGAKIGLLEVRAGNDAAIALYRRFGFFPVGRRSAYYPDGEDALLMERSGAEIGGAAAPSAAKEESSPMKNIKTMVLSNMEISPGYFRMRILAPGFGRVAKPGQFLMFRVQQSLPPLLRRPFGIFRTGFLPPDCDGLPAREYVEILYKVVGRGTEIMCELHEGDRVEMLGPLGRGFDPGAPATEKILVGGGIGLVPLYMLASALIETSSVRLLMGGRTRDDILAVTEFERLGVETYVSTDDGSLGEEGLVTQVLQRKLTKYPMAEVFACGPLPMLDAVQRICRERGTPLQVSLEALMACGVGACLGCVVRGAGHSEASPRYLCTCKEGPVFRAEQLDWQVLAGENDSCEGCRS